MNLLQSAECIDRHLTADFFSQNIWLDDDEELQALEGWLRDPASKALNRKQIGWLDSVNAVGPLLGLRDIAIMIARHWLSSRVWEANLPYSWIASYVSRLEEYKRRQDADATHSADHDNGQPITSISSTNEQPEASATSLTIEDQIASAAKWCKDNSGVSENALYHERLGRTYLLGDNSEQALSHFTKAQELPDCSWQVFQGLANVHSRRKQTLVASEYMETCIGLLRQNGDTSSVERNELASCLNQAAQMHIDLGDESSAVAKLEEAISVDPYFYRSYYMLFSIYHDSSRVSDASKLLNGMSSKSAEKSELTQLEDMLLEYTKWMETIEAFELFLQASKRMDVLHLQLPALQQALLYAQNNKMQEDYINLLLAHGVALAHYSANESDVDMALSQWEKCCDMVFGGGYNTAWSTALVAAKCIFNHHFSKFRTLESGHADLNVHLDKLRVIAKRTRRFYVARHSLNSSLAAVYSRLGDRDQSNRLLLDEIKSGLDLLSDDDPSNDDDGFKIMGYVFVHTGEDLDALSALSLIGPPQRLRTNEVNEPTDDADAEKTTGIDLPIEDASVEQFLSNFCDGRCNLPCKWSEGLWFCKICPDVQFHDECLNKLQSGALPRLVCSPDHEWLYVPPWTDEFQATGKGCVRTGGEFKDGRRIGGSIVPVAEWLDSIREKWGLPKTPPKAVEDK